MSTVVSCAHFNFITLSDGNMLFFYAGVSVSLWVVRYRHAGTITVAKSIVMSFKQS